MVCGGCNAEVPIGALHTLYGVDLVYADMLFDRLASLPVYRICGDCAGLIADARSRAHIAGVRL